MKYSRTNENGTTIENKFCDIFPNQVFMEEVPWIKTMGKKRVCKHSPLPLIVKDKKLK